MKAIVPVLILATVALSACGNGEMSPFEYLKRREAGEAIQLNVVFESIGFWQKECQAQTKDWQEALPFCEAKSSRSMLCEGIHMLGDSRRKGSEECVLGR